MNDHFSKNCLALMVGLLAVIALNPREEKLTPKSTSPPWSGGGGGGSATPPLPTEIPRGPGGRPVPGP
jgi:hypothetical protein